MRQSDALRPQKDLRSHSTRTLAAQTLRALGLLAAREIRFAECSHARPRDVFADRRYRRSALGLDETAQSVLRCDDGNC